MPERGGEEHDAAPVGVADRALGSCTGFQCASRRSLDILDHHIQVQRRPVPVVVTRIVVLTYAKLLLLTLAL